MAELKPGTGNKVGDTQYEYGADLHTEGTPIIDPGIGRTVSIRVFDFKMNPTVRGFNDKQAIFNSHAKQISTILWGDGLIPLEQVPPRVIIDYKKWSYKIFVPCEARLGTLFVDAPKNLSEELAKNAKPNKKGKLDSHK